MLKFFVIMTLCVSYSFSQSENVETKVNFVAEKSTEITSNPITIEASPTLEEQGFKAIPLENNKVLYRKEVNGIIVEFKPEEL